MTHWPGWLGGIALALVMLAHWFGVGRMMAVSGRISAIVDRLRHGRPEDAGEEMSESELIAALRGETRARFGADALGEPARPKAGEPEAVLRGPQPFAAHPLFFLCLAAGGLLGTASNTPTFMLRSEGFVSLVGGSQVLAVVVLLFAGVLVGFGTRMAGGCTSGHGLCGASRGERGSLLATAAFFGAGVVLSLALGRLL
jgi:hypothetical protein